MLHDQLKSLCPSPWDKHLPGDSTRAQLVSVLACSSLVAACSPIQLLVSHCLSAGEGCLSGWLRLSVEVCREAEWESLEGDTAMADLEKGVSTWCVANCELYTVCKILKEGPKFRDGYF